MIDVNARHRNVAHSRIHSSSQRASVLASLAAVLLLAGCSGEGASTTVQGKITFHDKPVTVGLINFMPAQGKPLGGEIQSDATYSYDLPPGQYKIRIDTPDPASAAAPQEQSAVTATPAPATPTVQTPLPPQYANFDTSGLTLTVGGDSPQQHDIKLP